MRYKICLSVWALLLVAGCVSVKPTPVKLPSLHKYFSGDFMIGAAVNPVQFEGKDSAAAKLLIQQFNAVTPENCMKAAIIHPGWSDFNFVQADSLIIFAANNKLAVNAHTLIWHEQLPAFMRNMADADSVRQYLKTHITTLAGRYDGKVDSWDVVNEALNEDGSLRNTIFRQKLGDNYVIEAFRLAQAAAKHTKLYYNDYNLEQPRKRAGALALMKSLQQAGVRIDGIGIQGHWHLHHVPLAEIEESIRVFSALGIKVMFTELDISVLPSPGQMTGADVNQRASYNVALNPYAGGLPDSLQAALADDYKRLFQLLLRYKNDISRVTFWGVNDAQSWLNNWPVRGRTDYPLMFDRQNKPKPAFYALLNTKKY